MPGTALIFDTETSGMFDFSRGAHEEGQPRMLSISAALIDPYGGELYRMHDLIKPDGFEVDEAGEAFAINGLTNEMLHEGGKPVAEVLEEYDALVEQCDFISAFSVRFDQKVIRAEKRHLNLPDGYGYRPTFEIMYKARSLACDTGQPYSNPRKLLECYANICGKELDGAHDAQVDMDATIDIYRRLLVAEMVEPKEQVSSK